MNKDKFTTLSHPALISILVGAAFFVLMAGNEIISLTHPDEVFYTQTAKEMLAHKSFMTPYIFDQPQFEKPIFTYWLLMAAIKAFGLTPFAARFWPAFFGIVGVVATFWLAMLLFGNKRTAFLSGVVLMTSFIYLALSRAVLTDMIFSIWVVLALCCFYYGYSNEKRRGLGIILCFICSAIAVLTKGALGIVFPFGSIVFFLLYKKDLGFFRNWATLWGILIFLGLAVPWHVLMFKLYGSVFVEEYWKNDHIRRILEAEHQKSNTWYFYLGTMFAGVFPWSFFLVPAGYAAYKSLRSAPAKRDPDQDKFAFLLLWIAVVFVVVQSAQSKLASYVFPVFPAIAIVLGCYFSRALEGQAGQRSLANISLGLAGFLAVVSIGSIIAAKHYIEIIVHLGPVYIFAVASFVCAAAIFFFTRARQYGKVFFVTACITLIVLITLFLGHSYAEPWVSCKQICDVLNKEDRSDSVLLCSKFYVRGVRFYTDRKAAVIDINGEGFFSDHPIPFLNNDQKVQDFLESQLVTYCVVKKSNVKDLRRITEGRYSIVEIEEIGGKYILRIEKLSPVKGML